MIVVEGTWLHGPALELLLQAKAMRPGDFVKVNGIAYTAYGIPRDVSKVGVLVDSPNLVHRNIVHHPQWVYLYGATSVYSLSIGNIRAWMRKPLDLGL